MGRWLRLPELERLLDGILQAMKMTQDELVAEARKRFGDDAQKWAFICPCCGDVAVASDFPDGSEQLGQWCVGNFGFDRGCDWKAFGLIQGPVEIVMPDGHSAWGFELAP